jgi:DNA double-strand break repair helicase HerA and related ATPase
VSPDAHSPAERADAVLRAAEAAAAAAQAAAAAAHAASLPAPGEAPPQPAAVPEEPAPPEPPALAEPPPIAEPPPVAEPAAPPVHEAGSPARLLAAAGELEAQVAQARAQLDALEDALARVERPDDATE